MLHAASVGSLSERRSGVESSTTTESEQTDRRLRALEQHVEVLQAQVDALQSQLQKEASRSASLGRALRDSHTELRAAQQTAAECIQAIFELGHQQHDLDGRTNSTVAISDPGAECAAAIERLRAKVAAVPGDLGSDLSSTIGSPRNAAQPPKLPPRGPQMRRASDMGPMILGRGCGEPPQAPEAKAMAAALAREREREMAGGDRAWSASPTSRRRSETALSFDGSCRSPVQRMRTTDSVRCSATAEHLLNEINQLRELNSALREENLEVRDRMLRKSSEGQLQQAQQQLANQQQHHQDPLQQSQTRLRPPVTTQTVGGPMLAGPPAGAVVNAQPVQRMQSLGALPGGAQSPPSVAHRIISGPGVRTLYQPVLQNRVVVQHR